MTLVFQARNAIVAACRAFGVGSGSEILAPAYYCGTEIDALGMSGAKVILYRVDRNARIDANDLASRTTKQTRVVYVTHYFGWPQDVDALGQWCRQRGILLFEDCALSLFSSAASVPIGSAGDAAFFSFPKTLPTPDGGALTTRDPCHPPQQPSRSPPALTVLRRCMSLVKRKTLASIGPGRIASALRAVASLPRGTRDNSNSGVQRPPMPDSYYFDRARGDWAATRVTQALLCSVAVKTLVEARRRNFARLLDSLRWCDSLRPLFSSLPDGVCPLGFPVIVKNRRQWCSELGLRGVESFRWWEGYHRDFDCTEFSDARYLKDHVLVLPVHQDLSERHMKYIASNMDQLSSREAAMAVPIPPVSCA